MSGHRPTRANSNLADVPLHQLQLPPRTTSGRPTSPSTPAGPGRARGLSPRQFSPRPGQQTSFPFADAPSQQPHSGETDERFEDALNIATSNSSSSSASATAPTMSQLMEPPGENASIEEIRCYAQAMRDQAMAFSASLASTSKLLEASLNNQAPKPNTRRPELPPFDQKNILSWIRRVENAFARVNITSPKEKFAHLESVISVDLHPTINQLFNETPTADNYNGLLTFLREKYGRTKEQKVQSAMNGVRRNGRTPMDLAALIDEQIDDITIEDIKKAHFTAEMPQSVRHSLATQGESLSFRELAKAAEVYFNRDGSLRASENRVNAVTSSTPSDRGATSASPPPTNNFQPNFTSAFESDTTSGDINAVNYRSSNRSTNRSQSRSRNTSTRGRGSSSRSSSRPNPSSNSNFCWLHNKFGNEARYCKPPCNHPKANAMQQQQQQQQPAGNARGGRR